LFRKLIVPALLLIAPSAVLATPSATHELLRAPAGKSVMLYREINRETPAAIKCHPDSTKAFLCIGRSQTQSELASRAQPERLSER
jgi:hypothetical protein